MKNLNLGYFSIETGLLIIFNNNLAKEKECTKKHTLNSFNYYPDLLSENYSL